MLTAQEKHNVAICNIKYRIIKSLNSFDYSLSQLGRIEDILNE